MIAKRVLLSILSVYVVWLAFAYEYHFIDGVNLLFHEAGHLFLGFMGDTVHFLGGTIGQLFFPVACAVHFLKDGKHFEAWLMGIWFAESLMNTARYLGDAQAQMLPLVGGHIHDWNWLLGRWGVLPRCESIAATLHVLAVGLAVGCLIAAWRATDSVEELFPSGWSAADLSRPDERSRRSARVAGSTHAAPLFLNGVLFHERENGEPHYPGRTS